MNVYLSSVCEDCRFHTFPYKATPPISGYGEQVFETESDIKDVIGLLINEVKDWNNKGKKFDIASSISKQIPFFCCVNMVVKKEYQRIISKFIYCNETKIPAYSGSYGKQPNIWIEQYFVLKNAFAYLEKNLIEKNK